MFPTLPLSTVTFWPRTHSEEEIHGSLDDGSSTGVGLFVALRLLLDRSWSTGEDIQLSGRRARDGHLQSCHARLQGLCVHGLPYKVSTDRHAAISNPETRAVYRCRPQQ